MNDTPRANAWFGVTDDYEPSSNDESGLNLCRQLECEPADARTEIQILKTPARNNDLFLFDDHFSTRCASNDDLYLAFVISIAPSDLPTAFAEFFSFWEFGGSMPAVASHFTESVIMICQTSQI